MAHIQLAINTNGVEGEIEVYADGSGYAGIVECYGVKYGVVAGVFAEPVIRTLRNLEHVMSAKEKGMIHSAHTKIERAIGLTLKTMPGYSELAAKNQEMYS